uniref:Zgc:194202 n=1 Tax=Oryzias melastigma TaxID=30732 RepID=A0A3B3DS46_ORYME
METNNSTAFTTNTSTSGHLLSSSWDITDLTRAAVLSLSFLLGFSGNIAVLILKPNIQTLSPLSQSLMLNLAVSDLLCVLTLPFWIYDQLFSWTLGLVACKLLTFLLFLSIFCSLLTVTLLSVQRYLVVVKQRNALNHFGAKRLLVLLWIASLIASIPNCITRKEVGTEVKKYCGFDYSSEALRVVLIEEMTVGFITMFIVAFSYISLYRKVNRSVLFNHPQTTRLISSVTVTFFLLYFPYHVINVLSLTAMTQNIKDLMDFCTNSRYTFGAIVLLSSALNPLLYAFNSCNFWRCTEKLKCWGRNSVVSQSQSNNTTTDAVSVSVQTFIFNVENVISTSREEPKN